ncbi:hypothetical protein WMY93_009233 [Mugilogobius chulae]|uniref:Uncharacterized protein n=1 Tax=Mugilogobius chulae TaxID=88201 RepID=A0AAW0PAY5_9GOBI
MKIGGARGYVVIDESSFRHKRKYNRGRFGRTWKNRNSWVFGILESQELSWAGAGWTEERRGVQSWSRLDRGAEVSTELEQAAPRSRGGRCATQPRITSHAQEAPNQNRQREREEERRS